MTDKRMSEERLAYYREDVEADGDIAALVAEIDALRAELTAARTVGDEVESVLNRIQWAREAIAVDAAPTRSGYSASITTDDVASADRALDAAADLLTRLSAAKAEAERERDEAREALKEARGYVQRDTQTLQRASMLRLIDAALTPTQALER